MKLVKPLGTLKAVVSLAGTLGELRYRRSLVQEELKTIEHRTRTERAWIKKAKRHGAELTRRTEMLSSFQEILKRLARVYYLAVQESEQLERLEAEIKGEMNQKIVSLTKRLA